MISQNSQSWPILIATESTESTYEAAFVKRAHSDLPMSRREIGELMVSEPQEREHAHGFIETFALIRL